jgi:hypothetical protein
LIENTKEKSTTRNFGDKTLVKVYLDRDSLALAKSRTKIQDTQEFLQQLVLEKLEQTSPKLNIKPKLHKQNSKPRSLSLSKRAFIIKKANNQCELCQSKFNLEIDHKKPVAFVGDNSIANLRLLCRPCNLRQGIKLLGQRSFDQYLD